MSNNENKKISLVLDMDGTLIDERNKKARPHLEYFLDYCFSNCEAVGLWTAASSE